MVLSMFTVVNNRYKLKNNQQKSKWINRKHHNLFLLSLNPAPRFLPFSVFLALMFTHSSYYECCLMFMDWKSVTSLTLSSFSLLRDINWNLYSLISWQNARMVLYIHSMPSHLPCIPCVLGSSSVWKPNPPWAHIPLSMPCLLVFLSAMEKISNLFFLLAKSPVKW